MIGQGSPWPIKPDRNGVCGVCGNKPLPRRSYCLWCDGQGKWTEVIPDPEPIRPAMVRKPTRKARVKQQAKAKRKTAKSKISVGSL